MAATPESKVKKKVVAQLKEAGVYFFYPVTGGYGRSGVPDIVCCYKGRFFGFECKSGNNKPTVLQQMNLDEISDNGGVAVVINEDNVDTVSQILAGTQPPQLPRKEEVKITHCPADVAEDIVRLRDEKAWSYQRIANKVGFNPHQVRRYYRVYNTYGPGAFAPNSLDTAP